MPDKYSPSKIKIIKSEEEIKQRIKELALEIDKAFNNEDIVVVGILKGAFIFFSDLIRELNSELICEFLATSDYAEGHLPSGEVKITLDLNSPIVNKNVLLVEDIVSHPAVFAYLARTLEARQAKTIKTCCFVQKERKNKEPHNFDFVGFKFPEDQHIIGYGIDYEGRYRNIPYLGQIDDPNK